MYDWGNPVPRFGLSYLHTIDDVAIGIRIRNTPDDGNEILDALEVDVPPYIRKPNEKPCGFGFVAGRALVAMRSGEGDKYLYCQGIFYIFFSPSPRFYPLTFE